MKPNTIILTNGILSTSDAKTAHGLIRGTDRFEIVSIIDAAHVGRDLSSILGGKVCNIPIYSTAKEALKQQENQIDYVIIGVANKGGKLPSDIKPALIECLENNISVINGLHEFVSDMPDLASLAKEKGLTITDIRKPADRNSLHFWTGEIYDVKCPVIAVMGMDNNIGKRTTARMLKNACRDQGLAAEMVFTGQTGWLQDGKYGFILDSTVNDFVVGELEYWICKCYKETHPDVIFVEGQASLRRPSGPCGAEFLISGNARKVVLVFSPKKVYFDNNQAWGKIPPVEDEIKLINMYGSEVIALAVNTKNCTSEEAEKVQRYYHEKLGIPVLLPLEEGVDDFVSIIQKATETMPKKA
jgi:uncharacterized NAD-dependent epimerase/dehydratase family protein